MDVQAVPVQPLEYQLPAEAAASPWATVVRAIGWAAVGLAAAQLAVALSVLVFWLGLRGNISLNLMWTAAVASSVLYVPVLIGGLGCARLRPYGWKVLTYTLWVVLASKALLVLATPLAWSDSFPGSFGVWARVGQMGQSIFSLIGDAVPLVLMVWVLRRPGVREQFDVPRQIPWAPEVN